MTPLLLGGRGEEGLLSQGRASLVGLGSDSAHNAPSGARYLTDSPIIL